MLNHPTGFDSEPFNWLKFIENFLFWSVWGCITALCYRAYWNIRKAGMLLLIAVGLVPGILLEFLQIFIVSRYCNINDVISNWAGVLFGSLFYSINLTNSRFSPSDYQPQLKGAVWLYFAFIMFAGLQPFDFQFSAGSLRNEVNLEMIVPFLSYFKNTSIWNISDLVTSLLYFFPISVYLSYHLRQRLFNWRTVYIVTGFAGLLLGCFIELFQIYSSTRVSDITDVLLFCAGGLLGTFALYYYTREIQPLVE